MKRLAVWMLIGALMLGMVYGLAESNIAATLKPDDVQGLKYGDEGEQVAALQKRMKELSYYSGDINGLY